jgi:cytochrome P450 family 110
MPLPPGPSQHPLLQTRAWLNEPYPFLDRCRAAYGDTFTIRLAGFSPMVITGDPAMVHAVFTGDIDVMLAGAGNDILLPFLGPTSLLTLDGKRHTRDRRLMTPPFHGQRMRVYGVAIEAATQRAIAGWRTGEVQAQPAMQAASLEVILRAVFGVEEQASLALATGVIVDLLDSISAPLIFLSPLRVDLGPWSPWGRYKKKEAQAKALVAQQIAHRRAEPGEDILSLLLAARDETGAGLTEEELYSELVTLLVAGHETTANALSWSLAWLGSEPQVRERLQAEIDAAGTDPELTAKLPFLSAVCSEALRLHPLLPIVVRVMGRAWEHGQWTIPQGYRVAPCMHLVHTREDLYPDAGQFRPDRFLERTFSSSEFVPFGGGVRRCIGSAFALYEMKLALATILRTVRLGDSPRPVPERRNVAVAPAGGAPIRIIERRG